MGDVDNGHDNIHPSRLRIDDLQFPIGSTRQTPVQTPKADKLVIETLIQNERT
jgi:hypothetical protein